MSMQQQRRSEPVARATWYVARLYSGEMTAKDEDDLFSWLEADPAHRKAYSEALAVWDAAGDLSEDQEILAVARPPSERFAALRSTGGWIAAAAIVIVAAVTITTAWNRNSSDSGNVLASYETAVGEQRVVALNDGSRITLNTGSRILVDYTPLERRIILDFGEAFFDIEEDLQRPLVVSARERTVTVLGTKFSVRLSGSAVRVAVIEGTVAVSKQENRFPRSEPQTSLSSDAKRVDAPALLAGRIGPDDMILRAGTMVTFDNEEEQVIESDAEAVDRLQSWRDGLVRFDSEPLFRVVGELNRYSKTKILIEDDTIMNLPISGAFKLERVDLILNALTDVIPIEVVRYSDRYVLVHSGNDDSPRLSSAIESADSANQ
ncbi:MAG: DUF4974 domain-containing protein [Gammaproteobacteria bacterium]|nr:DUF4974 domain-containing protein [Gammaproteobacteria bacterium]